MTQYNYKEFLQAEQKGHLMETKNYRASRRHEKHWVGKINR